MRLANLNGRAVILKNSRAIDIDEASDSVYGPDPLQILDQWHSFLAWASSVRLPHGSEFDPIDLGAPVPAPRQIFAVGLNYESHAAESIVESPSTPVVFTKFQSSITGPFARIELPPGGFVDWEVELVVVIGKVARTVQEQDAWQYAAGVTIGQDLSERIRQFEGASPQYSLGKSFSGFGPTGPCIVTIDELGDADDLAISCEVNQEVVQEDRTSSMIFSVPALIAHLSGILQLYPGDLIFTGTPAGVGFARTPRRKIEPGTKLTSRIEGIGEISQTFL
jgi:2-keto-4-pentenoate hydratase/2-oxohepta-3-ene-1,7-dioic acid hydratase in catechol pathway